MKKIILILLLINSSLSIANAQWVKIYNLFYGPASCFTDNGNILYAATSGGVYKSTNLGINWIYANNGITSNVIYSIAAKDSIIYAGTQGGMFISKNFGNNWILSSITATVNSVIIANEFVFAGTDGGLYKTSNWGNNWISANNGLLINPKGRSLAFSNNIIFAGIVGFDSITLRRTYKSTDFGNNWIFTSQEIPNNTIPYSLYTYNNLVLCGTASGVFISTNTGVNWNLITGISGNIGLFGFSSVGTKNIFIGAWNNGFYVSNDYGQNWIQRNEGLESISSNALHKFSDYLFLSTNPPTYYSELYRRPVSEIVGIKPISTEIPNKYKLEQNYPNPFNSNSKIKFCIPENGKWSATSDVKITKMENGIVTLKVYDILGKEIATLVNENLQVGTYEVTFDGSNLATGIYFYSLFADNKLTEIKKLTLIK